MASVLLFIAVFAMAEMKKRRMILLKLKRRSLKRKHLKARKRPLPVLARFQKRKRKKSKETLRKAEVFVVVAEVAEVVVKVFQNRTSSPPHVNLQR